MMKCGEINHIYANAIKSRSHISPKSRLVKQMMTAHLELLLLSSLVSLLESLLPGLSLSISLSRCRPPLACCFCSVLSWWLHKEAPSAPLELQSWEWCCGPGATARHFSQSWRSSSSSSAELWEDGGVNCVSSPLLWGSWPRGGNRQAEDWMILLGAAVLQCLSNPRARPKPSPVVSVVMESSWPSSQLPQHTQELSRQWVATRGPQGSTSEGAGRGSSSLSTASSAKLGERGLKMTVAESFIPPIRWAMTSAFSDAVPSNPISQPLV